MSDSDEVGLEAMSVPKGGLTDADKRKLEHALEVDRLRAVLSAVAAGIAVAVPIGTGVWVAYSSAPVDLPRALLVASAVATCVALLRFSDRVGIPLSDRQRMEASRADRNPRDDLVDALRTVTDTIKEIVGRKSN